jgi:hypothetical protein
MYMKVNGKNGAAPHTKMLSAKQRPAFNKRGEKLVDTRVSVCILCRKGIFPQHDYKWTSNGLVHCVCDDKENNETEDVSSALSE